MNPVNKTGPSTKQAAGALIAPLLERHFSAKERMPCRIVWKRGKRTLPLPLNHHPDLEFQYIKRGRGSYLIGGRLYSFQKNSLLIVLPGDFHRFIPAPGVYMEKASLFMAARALRRSRSLADFPKIFPRHIVLPEIEATNVEAAFNRIQREMAQQDEHWTDIVTGELKIFLCLVKRLSKQPLATARENPLVAQMAEYIEGHFTQDLRLPAIARVFGYSPNYLAHIFKEQMGIGPKQYILQCRVAEAKRILQTERSLTVRAVAQQVGFDDFGLFNRCFKRLTAMRPAAYRNVSERESAGP